MRETPLTLPAPGRTASLRLEPQSGWQPVNLRELWEYRELLWFLAMRDIKVRYKQTALGAAWAIIQPVFMMLVFVLIATLGKLPSGNSPRPVFMFCALLPWQLFANALTNASNSLVNEQRLISKVYFPRLIVPIAAVLGGLVDFLIAFVFFLVMMFFYHITPTAAVITLPFFILLAVLAALAVALWLSALNVQYRDVRYTLPFLTQFWLLLTPILYPSSSIPERWRMLYSLNPMAGVVEGFRWALLGNAERPGWMLLVSTFATILLLIGGLFYFRRMERQFADIV